MATADSTIQQEAPTPVSDGSAQTDAAKRPDDIFKFSAFVHVGFGADECDEGEKGTCSNPLHFHAYCRLPNQYQHDEIRDRALAAKARRIRQLRDPESDAYVVHEVDMDALRGVDEDLLIDELVGKDWWKRQLDGMREVEAREEYERIQRDRERLRELEATLDSTEGNDEYAELVRHIAEFGRAVDEEVRQREEPLRNSLGDKSHDELVALVSEDRIAKEASKAFMATYGQWQVFAGTLKVSSDGRHRIRHFTELKDLVEADTEVVEALRQMFAELEASLQRGVTGNS